MKRFWMIALCMMLAAALVVFTACSSAGESEQTATEQASVSESAEATEAAEETTEAAEEAAAPAGLAEELAQYYEDPTFTFEGEAFDAKATMEGKKVFVLPQSSSNPFSVGIYEAEQLVAEEVGFELFVYENGGTVDEWIQGMELAISQGYDYIELEGGVDPRTLESQITLAQEAGIKVYTTHYESVGSSYGTNSCDFNIKAPMQEAARAMGLYAINEVGAEDINCLVINCTGLEAQQPMKDGVESAFADYAPGQYTIIEIPVTDWATKLQTEVQSALQSDPTINYIIADYDNMLTYVVPAIEMVGVQDTVKCASFNGSPGILTMVKNGSVDMDLGESLMWIGYANMDGMMRDAAGLDIPDDSGIPLYIWNADNIERNLDENGDTTYGGFLDDICTGAYQSLWGLS